MAVTDSQLAALTVAKKSKSEALAVSTSFRKKYGIPPKGTPPEGGWADSDYGFPLPPNDHPQAYQFARALVSRAHQNTRFDPKKVAARVKRAEAIIKKHSGERHTSEGDTPWRKATWVDISRKRRDGTFAEVAPKEDESLTEFRERCPVAVPKAQAMHLSEAQRVSFLRNL